MIAILFLLGSALRAQMPDYEAWKDALAVQGSTGLLVAKHDKTVYEWYAPGWDAAKPYGAPIGKSPRSQSASWQPTHRALKTPNRT